MEKNKINRQYLNEVIRDRTGETKMSHACLKMGRELEISASCVNNFRYYTMPKEESFMKILSYLKCDLNKLFNINE